MAWKTIMRGDPTARKLVAFACVNCHHIHEELWREGDPKPNSCPACGCFEMKPLFSCPSLIFFKEGYYEHSSPDGVHASSMAQLEEDCEKAGNRVVDKPDVGWKRHRQRWV